MFIPPQELLPLNDMWARLASVAILGVDDVLLAQCDQGVTQSAGHLATLLELARQDGAFTIRHKPVIVTVETSRSSSWVHGWRHDPLPARTSTRTTLINAVRMLDLVRWAHTHGFSVASGYAPYLSIQMVEIESAEAVEDELPKKNPTLPKLLTAPEIGRAFNNINGWTRDQWTRNIGKAAWAKPAKTDGGGRPSPDLWDPAKLTNCLLKKNGDAESESLAKAFDKAFRTHRLLADWKSEWANYAEHWGINPPT